VVNLLLVASLVRLVLFELLDLLVLRHEHLLGLSLHLVMFSQELLQLLFELLAKALLLVEVGLSLGHCRLVEVYLREKALEVIRIGVLVVDRDRLGSVDGRSLLRRH